MKDGDIGEELFRFLYKIIHEDNDFDLFCLHLHKIHQMSEFHQKRLFMSVWSETTHLNYFKKLAHTIESVDILEYGQGRPLRICAEHGLTDVADMLMTRGVDPNLYYADALSIAYDLNNTAMILLLKKHGGSERLMKAGWQTRGNEISTLSDVSDESDPTAH
jgi:hypothetical protein